MNESMNIEFQKLFIFEKRGKSFRGSILQMIKLALLPWTRLIDQINTLKRLYTLPTIHNQAFLPKLFIFIKARTRSR
jgi:hypothetical protein